MGPTELRREDGQSALKIGLNATAPIIAARGAVVTSATSNALKRPRSRFSSAFGGEEEKEGEQQDGRAGAGSRTASSSSSAGSGGGKGKGKRSVMEVLMEQERAKKAAKLEEESAAAAAAPEATTQTTGTVAAIGENGGREGTGSARGSERKEYWLRPGIVVKVMNKKVGGGKYYKKKARIRKVVERYVGEVKMLESGDRLRVDQEDLETVRRREAVCVPVCAGSTARPRGLLYNPLSLWDANVFPETIVSTTTRLLTTKNK